MIATKTIRIVLSVTVLAISVAAGQDKKEEKKEEPGDPNRLFFADFEDLAVGDVPRDYFVVEGDWKIVERDGGKSLMLAAHPLAEASVQLGPALRDGAVVVARIAAQGTRRSFPRYGVALHGLSGFRLRVVPARKIVELARNDEPVASAPFDPPAGAPVRLKLRAEKQDETRWRITGWAWPDGETMASKPLVSHTAADVRLSGKASVTGTPYAGLPIYFDAIEVRKYPEEKTPKQ